MNQQELVTEILSQANIWGIRNGSVEIHFDAQGTPVKVEKHEHFRLSTG